MGETRVDLLHLLEDLRDAYTGAIEETILSEMVANSLDSGASRVRVEADAAQALLTVVDNGSGMRRRELARYHDVAASTKIRGQGIGFAGVGIKLGLLVSEEVLTETRSGKAHVATTWHLASRHRAPWKWVSPPNMVEERGTAVRLKLQNALSPLLDPGFLEASLRRHYQPLLDPAFEPFLVPYYPHGITFEVNDHLIQKQRWQMPESAPLEIRLIRKRKPSAVGYMVRQALPLSEEQRGIAISTFGKIIKRGWDWLGVSPVTPERIGGLIEVPELATCLTLNKGEFIRTGLRGATYLAYRKAIQEAVSKQLTTWGDAREPTDEARRRVTRPLERDLERVLVDLSHEFPLLASLVERHVGGQRRLPIEKGDALAAGRVLALASADLTTREAKTEPGTAESSAEPKVSDESDEPLQPGQSQPPALGPLPSSNRGRRMPVRYGLGIQFENRPGDTELGRLEQSTVWVNAAHPAYHRAIASRSEGYHVALSVALALAPLTTEPKDEHAFVTAFLSRWGEALERSGSQRRRTG